MKIETVTIAEKGGRRSLGTKISVGSRRFLVRGKISHSEAEKRIRQFERKGERVKGLSSSIDKFEEFNWKPPRRLTRRQLPVDVPFIRIGKVPLITYMSSKEGKMRSYKHETKRMPTLYMHPSKPFGVLIGGSLKVRDWLYD